MAKKQTRRSISVSRATYERLKSFCETNGISMSQFVENRVGDVLGEDAGLPATVTTTMPVTPRPMMAAPRSVERTLGAAIGSQLGSQLGSSRPVAQSTSSASGLGGGGHASHASASAPHTMSAGSAVGSAASSVAPSRPAPAPMTSVAARFAVDPPPPIIKPRVEHQAPKSPSNPTADQIFTF